VPLSPLRRAPQRLFLNILKSAANPLFRAARRAPVSDRSLIRVRFARARRIDTPSRNLSMNSSREVCWTIAAVAAVTLGAGTDLPQPHDTHQPTHPDERATPAKESKADDRLGDPYALDTCPTTGKKLGTMGDPVVKLYNGREVRFCCPACPAKFEKDQTTNVGIVDEKLIKDQGPLYPLKTSVVTGQDLPAKPHEFVHGNRLIRLGAESEKADFLKDPKKHLVTLDQAVVEQQGKDYALKTCPVSNEAFGGEMGEPVDLVIAGRLVRLCCKACKKGVEKDPAKFVAIVDAALRANKAKPEVKPKRRTVMAAKSTGAADAPLANRSFPNQFLAHKRSVGDRAPSAGSPPTLTRRLQFMIVRFL
jgi:hypothetical protein